MPRTLTPQQKLDSFLAKFLPETAALGRAAAARLREFVPGAKELVYDNYNFFVIGFSPNERPSNAIFSIAMQAKGVALCFLQGAKLPDPHKRLRGSGNVVRSVRIESAADFDDPVLQTLINEALARAKVKMIPSSKRKLIIQSVSKKQRPRRPSAAKKKHKP